MKRIVAAFLAANIATNAHAFELSANWQSVVTKVETAGRYDVPLSVFDGEKIRTLAVTGTVQRRAWTIDASDQTLLKLTEDLASQLEKNGFRRALDCLADACGGFDFRFGIEVLPAPEMYVNLRNFQYMTFLKGPDDMPTQATTILVSINAGTAYLQIIDLNGSTDQIPNISTSPPTGSGEAKEVETQTLGSTGTSLGNALLERGSAVLEGLEFETGATTLGEGPFPVLGDLAAFLRENSDLNIALVGHTDSTGSLEGNLGVSKARAASVRTRLISIYGANGDKIRAEGMGYLAPRASNLSEQGRQINRRVEVILLSTN